VEDGVASKFTNCHIYKLLAIQNPTITVRIPLRRMSVLLHLDHREEGVDSRFLRRLFMSSDSVIDDDLLWYGTEAIE
jgi:hypothetical protein